MTERENLWTMWFNEDGTKGMSPYLIHDAEKARQEMRENDERNQTILDSRTHRASAGQGDEAVAHEEVPR